MSDPRAGSAKGLCDRLGGVESVRSILDRFYARLFDDVLVGFFFVGHDRAKIVDGQLQFLRWATGDRDDLPGRHPRTAHDELPPILGGHFDRRLVVLDEVLRDEGVADAAEGMSAAESSSRWLQLPAFSSMFFEFYCGIVKAQ